MKMSVRELVLGILTIGIVLFGLTALLAKPKIDELKEQLIDALTPLCSLLNENSEFYAVKPNSYDEALKRANYL